MDKISRIPFGIISISGVDMPQCIMQQILEGDPEDEDHLQPSDLISFSNSSLTMYKSVCTEKFWERMFKRNFGFNPMETREHGEIHISLRISTIQASQCTNLFVRKSFGKECSKEILNSIQCKTRGHG